MNCFRVWVFIGCCSLAASAVVAQSPTTASRFHFREPGLTTYRVETSSASLASTRARPAWVTAWPENDSRPAVEIGIRVALQLKPGTDIHERVNGSPLKRSSTVACD